jgi:hypothetical protein
VAAPTELLEALRQVLTDEARKIAGAGTLPAGATAAEFSAVRFGGPTRMVPSAVTAGVSRQRLLGNNPRRIGWLAFNLGTTEGRISTDPALTSATGLPVQANGGGVSMDVLEDGEAVAWEWYVITTAAAQAWSVFEIERV